MPIRMVRRKIHVVVNGTSLDRNKLVVKIMYLFNDAVDLTMLEVRFTLKENFDMIHTIMKTVFR